jgi:hypothetical protein
MEHSIVHGSKLIKVLRNIRRKRLNEFWSTSGTSQTKFAAMYKKRAHEFRGIRAIREKGKGKDYRKEPNGRDIHPCIQ